MEIEASTAVIAKKLWNVVRVVLFMLRKGIAKSKIMVEFHLLIKRGKLAGKALMNNLMINHHHHLASFTCRSHNHHDPYVYISPCEYEFSCSNSPAIPIKRKHHHFPRFSKSAKSTCQYDDVSTFTAVQKVLEMLNHDSINNSPLPGFGKSPVGRQLRVTDSPFPLNEEGDTHVDVAAEEFIKNFYKDLYLQKRMAALESPYHYSWDR